MIIPDINLLLYAYQSQSPFYQKARGWWEGALNGSEGVGLPHEVILGFVRIATNPRLGQAAVSVNQAIEVVRSWFQSPVTQVLLPEPDHSDRVLELLLRSGGSGLLTSDATLAVYAIRTRATLCSNDGDFARFPDLQWANPLNS